MEDLNITEELLGTENAVRENAAEEAENACGIPETYVVTETRCCHSASSDSKDEESDGCGADINGRRGSDRKEKGFRINGAAIAAICLVCSILGGLLTAGLMSLMNNNAGSSGSNKTGTNKSADASSASQQINITVDSETSSPAVAVAKKVLPSIVGVRAVVTSTSYWYGTTTSGGEGSGVIVSEDGYIITNHHVISSLLTSAGDVNPNGSLSVFLSTDPDTAIPATLIGYDSNSDIAIIKIEQSGLTAIELGDSDKLTLGEAAFVVGNPGGVTFAGSISQGIISGLNRSLIIDSTYVFSNLIQTDAAINPGNSGGALTDASGRLIGISSAKVVSTDYESMCFAIPINDVMDICNDILTNGNKRVAYMGVEFDTSYSAATLERYGYPGGLVVKSVISGSPAEEAGIRSNDIIVEFNGTEVKTVDAFSELKNSCDPGDEVTIKLYRITSSGRQSSRSGEYIEVTVTLG